MSAQGRNDKPSSLPEIAQAIDAHLKRFEADKAINATRESNAGTRPYYGASCFAQKRDRKARVTYVSFQGTTLLSRDEALAYLAWLDAGNVGRHFEQQREARGGAL